MSSTSISIRWMALLLVLPAAAAGASCTVQTRDCTAVGCEDGASITLDFPAPAATDVLHVKICRNDVCSTSVPTDAGAPYRTCAVTGDLGDVICYFVEQQQGRLQLNLQLRTEYSPDHAILHDGDTYKVTVTTASGAAVADLEQQVTYEHFQPDGPECDKDFYCQSASVRKSL